jgi:predicted amidophosphoribosyltransferase
MDTMPPFPLILTLLVAVGLIAMGLLHRPRVRCSSCHKRWSHRFSFCPKCGAMLPPVHYEQTIRSPGDQRSPHSQQKWSSVQEQHPTRRRTRGHMITLSEGRSERLSGDSLLADPQRHHVPPLAHSLCCSCWEPLQPRDRFCGQCGRKVPVRKKRRY